jgi:hypothetical protein
MKFRTRNYYTDSQMVADPVELFSLRRKPMPPGSSLKPAIRRSLIFPLCNLHNIARSVPKLVTSDQRSAQKLMLG